MSQNEEGKQRRQTLKTKRKMNYTYTLLLKLLQNTTSSHSCVRNIRNEATSTECHQRAPLSCTERAASVTVFFQKSGSKLEQRRRRRRRTSSDWQVREGRD